jgi:hypothetical protein
MIKFIKSLFGIKDVPMDHKAPLVHNEVQPGRVGPATAADKPAVVTTDEGPMEVPAKKAPAKKTTKKAAPKKAAPAKKAAPKKAPAKRGPKPKKAAE